MKPQKTGRKFPMAEKGKEHLPAVTVSLAIENVDSHATMQKLSAASPEGLTPLSLDRISFVTAGSITYNVPTEDGLEPRQYLDAFVIHNHGYRQLYTGPYDPQNPSPPECVSWDGITGHGSPGGVCARCPFNVFGVDAQCKPYRWLYLLFPDEMLPTTLALPRTSLSRRLHKGITSYVIGLAKGGKLKVKGGLWPWEVMTRIGLAKRERGVGMVATFEEGPPLSKAHKAVMAAYVESFKKALTFPTLTSGGDPTETPPRVYGGAVPEHHNYGPEPDDEGFNF